ncbi:MAG: exo-beta-N-acetylmuramidase NamZ domain-containing protein [Planctomycetota bacterium]
MLFGIDRLLAERPLRERLRGKAVGVVAHPASVTADGTHTLDALVAAGIDVVAAFGPQHGLRGEKQDNMRESDDFRDARLGIPVHSLYGTVRRPTAAQVAECDVLLVDLQDVGCRVYTFLTTLRSVLEEAAAARRAVWVLDRPNPAGRAVEGFVLEPGQESFVGAGPLPMRHGLTLGEAAGWFVARLRLGVEWEVVRLEGWRPEDGPGFGWPLGTRSWVNPSPNAASPWMPRCYPGTVLLEGTHLSEGRGTTRPLELFGHPALDGHEWAAEIARLAPEWLGGCRLRPCWFEPTFHKHAGRLCGGLQIHVDDGAYDPARCRPWRIVAAALKAFRRLRPDEPLWRDFAYEYEFERLAIDVIDGGPRLRRWVDDPSATAADLDRLARPEEDAWADERACRLLYADGPAAPGRG